MGPLLILDPPPAFQALIEQRRALGQDHLDEVWEGVYHMAPAPSKAHALLDDALAGVLRPYALAAGLFGSGQFNLGDGMDNYRVPDRGFHRSDSDEVWVATAAIVVEILSPGDESYAKFDFYAAHGVEEIIIADPAGRSIEIWVRDAGSFAKADASPLLRVSADSIVSSIWPPGA